MTDIPEQPKEPFTGKGGPRPAIRPDDARGAPYGANPQTHGGAIGQPAHVFDPALAQKVEDLAPRCSLPGIAALCGFSLDTLRKYYMKHVHLGRAKVNSALGAIALKKALEGDLQAINMVQRGTGGWGNKDQLEVVGRDDGPVQHVDLSGLTDEQLVALRPILDQLLNSDPGERAG